MDGEIRPPGSWAKFISLCFKYPALWTRRHATSWHRCGDMQNVDVWELKRIKNSLISFSNVFNVADKF